MENGFVKCIKYGVSKKMLLKLCRNRVLHSTMKFDKERAVSL